MTPDKSDETLLRIATVMVDDGSVDWELEASSDPALQRKVRNLQLIQSIGDAHRSVRQEVLKVARPETPPKRSTWGKLKIMETLGSGSFGEVYRAWDPDLECAVALKLPHPEALAGSHQGDSYLREARQLAKVKHEHVLRVLGVETHDGRVGIWTELIEGQTLEESLCHTGRFGADEATSFGIAICRALAAVHGSGVIHRDVKTANVSREEGGRIVLLDFSAAANRVNGNDVAGECKSPPGTPRFMAPELLRGQPASVESDLYALGVVLYRLVTKEYPIEADTVVGLIERQKTGEIQPLRDRRPGLPDPFVHVVERVLDPNPDRRYSSAGEMLNALEAARHGAHSDPPDPPRKPWWMSWPVLVPAMAAAVLLLGIWLKPQLFPTSLSMDTVFFKIDNEKRAQRLAEWDELTLRDKVYLELEISRAAHVYVINADQNANRFALFPLPALDLANPLPRGIHRLPGPADGVPKSWNVTDPGGVETFLVIASNEPLDIIERELKRMPAAGANPVEIDGDLVLRGLGGMESVSDTDVRSLADRVRKLADGNAGLSVRVFYLRSLPG